METNKSLKNRVNCLKTDARYGWCQGCGRDSDLRDIPDEETYYAAATARPVIRVSIYGQVTTLCPDCVKELRRQLFHFSA